mgnify:CR=1 FL=1
MKRTVLEMLNAASINFKDTAYVSEKTDAGWQGTTYQEVNKLSDYMAISLIKTGVKHGDNIAIISEGRTAWIVTEYAILKIGAVCVPLSVKLQPDEILFRLQHSQTKFVAVSQNSVSKALAMAQALRDLDIKIIYLDKPDETMQPLNIAISQIYLYDSLINGGKEDYNTYREELNKRIKQVDENDTATISYTSGTTGNPKGIMLSHLNYWANSHDALRFFKLQNNMKLFIILPLDHSFAHTIGFYVATLCGLRLSFVDARGGAINQLKNIPINIKEVNPDFMLSVPALTGNFMRKIQDGINKQGGVAKFLFTRGMSAGIAYYGNGYDKPALLKRLWKYPIYKLADKIVFSKIRKIFGNNFQFFIGGGAALDIKQQQFFYTLGAPVYQGYGLTESSPVISVNCRDKHKFGSSGLILTGIDAKIIANDGKESPIGQKGILHVKALSVMKGYYKNEQATAETIKNDWLNTGDMAYIDKDNFLYVIGREKALLISSDGEKYSPEGIEEAITNSGGLIYQCVLYNDHCKYTTALITLDKNRVKEYAKQHKITDPEKLLEAVKKSFYSFTDDANYKNKFPKQWIPSVFNIIEEPFSEKNQMVNSTMKIVRFKVLETYKNIIERMYTAEGKTNCKENKEVLEKLLAEK